MQAYEKNQILMGLDPEEESAKGSKSRDKVQ